VPHPLQATNTSFVLRCLHILDFFTFSLSFPPFPLNYHVSQARNQVLTHLCERIFAFFKQCVRAFFFSNSILSATGSSPEGSPQGLPSPMYGHDEPYEGFPMVDCLQRKRMPLRIPRRMRTSPASCLTTSTVVF
jgi:hypothetical protein